MFFCCLLELPFLDPFLLPLDKRIAVVPVRLTLLEACEISFFP